MLRLLLCMGRPHMSLFLSEHDRSNAWCACVAKTALTPSSRCHKFAWELRTTNTKNRDQEEAKTASKAVRAAQCDPPHRWCVLIDVHAKQKQMSRFQLLVSAILPWVYLPGFQRLCYLAIWHKINIRVTNIIYLVKKLSSSYTSSWYWICTSSSHCRMFVITVFTII